MSATAEPKLDFGSPADLSRVAKLFRKYGQEMYSARQRGRPADFADLAARILKEKGEPLARGALVKEIESRGVAIPSVGKERYIGTILWRQKHRFINFEGVGYWLRSEPYEPMGYEPEPYLEPPRDFSEDVPSDDDYAD